MTPETARPVHLLVTCTANRVRSPIAAEIARAHVRRLGLPVEVRSAGRLAAGLPAVDDARWAAGRLGHDLGGHLSRTVDEELLGWADVVVSMTGEHVLDLVGLSADVRARALTLREWAAAAASGDHPSWTPDAVRSWAARVTARPLDVLLSGRVDVADPIGRPRRHYKRAAAEIDELLATCFAPYGEVGG